MIGAANLVPASAVALTEIIAEASLPKGLFNLVMGSVAIGNALVAYEGINAISFTGSVARPPIAAAAAATMPRLQMEMGSKNALVVMDDADTTLRFCAANAASAEPDRNAPPSRLIGHDAVHDEFVEKLVAAKGMKVGLPGEGTQIGPVVSEGQLSKPEYVVFARSEGGDILCGGDGRHAA